MKRPDLLLVAPPTRAYSNNFSFALLFLAAYIEKLGYCVEIIDLRPDYRKGHTLRDLEALCVQMIAEKHPRYLGFTCLTADFNCIERMASQVRMQGYRGTMIVGGHHPTFCPQDFLDGKNIFDYVVLGEGEQTLAELMEVLGRGGSVGQVSGIAYLDHGRLVTTSPRALAEDIDIFPSPAYHLIDMEPYLRPTTGMIRHILVVGLPIMTTRGCPYQCTYCGNPSLWASHAHRIVLRTRSVGLVLDEIEFLKHAYRIDAFCIADDAFTLNEERVRSFCQGLMDRRLGLIWACQTHVNLFTDRMAAIMREAGCIQVEFGVESGSDRVLKVMKKGTTTQKIREAFVVSRKHHLRTLANVMINTPTETEDDLKATIRFAKEIQPTVYSYAITTPLVGTEDYRHYVNPPLTPAEYEIYLDSSIYRKVMDRRFRLASHTLDLSAIYARLKRRRMDPRFYFDAVSYFLFHLSFYLRSFYRTGYRQAFLRRYLGFNRIVRWVNSRWLDQGHRLKKERN